MSILKIFRNLFSEIFAFLFLLSLSSLLILWILKDFTSEKNIKPLLVNVFYDSLEKQMDSYTEEQIKESIKIQCKDTDEISMPIGSFNISISCAEYKDINDTKMFLAEKISNSLYEKDYGCEINCLMEGKQDFLITKKANEKYTNLLIFNIVGTIFLGLMFFVLNENPVYKRIRSMSILILIGCLPGALLKVLLDPLKQELIYTNTFADPIIENLASISIKKYLTLFFVGLCCLVLSFLVMVFEKRTIKNYIFGSKEFVL